MHKLSRAFAALLALYAALWAIRSGGSLRSSQIPVCTLGSSAHTCQQTMSTAETITYAITILGILRAGHTAFPISPRNGPLGVADLLRRTQSACLIASQDDHTSAVAREAVSEVTGVLQHPMFELSQLLSPSAPEVTHAELPMMDLKQEDIGMIMHSSGENIPCISAVCAC